MKLQLIEDAIADLPSDAETSVKVCKTVCAMGSFHRYGITRRAFKTGTRSTYTDSRPATKIEERLNQVRRNSIAQVNSCCRY